MSFNDIAEFRKALSALSKNYPGLINAGQRNLLWVILTYPDGCFIGFQELALQVGLSTDTINGYLRYLTKLGFIGREQSYARKGLRQCYFVLVPVMLSYSLLPVTPKELESVLSESLPPVKGNSKPVTGDAIASDQSHTYKYDKYNKYDKGLRERLPIKENSPTIINVERWQVVSAYLDPYVKRKFRPNKESELLIDKILERPDMTLKGLRDHLGTINFSTSVDNTGFLLTLLRKLAGGIDPSVSHHKTKWCGKCDQVSRTFEVQGPGNDGKLTNDCPNCHDNQVRIKEREAGNQLSTFKDLGIDPDSFGLPE